MKYLLKYKVFENKVVDQLISKYKKYGKTIDDTDLEYFKKITKKLPNNLPRLVKWVLDGLDPDQVAIPYEYYLELRDKNLKVPDINQFEKPEDLYDALQLIEQQYRSNKIVQELPSNLKRQYKALGDKTEIDRLFLDLSKKDTKGLLISKISRYKTIEELSNVISNFLSSDSDGYRETVLSLQDDPDVYVKYFNHNVIVAEINSYKASCKYGSPSWCISTDNYYFDSYTSNNRAQLFVWDFNLKQMDPLSFIGITMNNFQSVIMATDFRSQVSNAHDRRDYNIRHEIVDILDKKKIPSEYIFFDRNGNKDAIFDYLVNMKIDSTIQYLNVSDDVETRDKLFKSFQIDKSDYYMLDANIKIMSSNNNFLKGTPYFTHDTLIKYLNIMSKSDPAYIISRKEKFTSPIVKGYYLQILKKSDIPIIIQELSNPDNNITSMSKAISNILLEKIGEMESINDQFDALFYWDNSAKFPHIAKNKLIYISLNHLNKLEPKNKVEALKLTRKNFLASKHLKNIENADENISVLNRIFKYKPLAKDRSEFVNNVINFMKRLSEEVLIDNIDDIYLDRIYMNKKVYDLYDLINHNDMIIEHRNFVYEIFKGVYDEYATGSKTTQKFIKSEIGFKILRDYDLNQFNDGNRSNIVSTTFNYATPKQIKNNLPIIDKYLLRNGDIHREDIQSLINTGDNELIKKHSNLISKYFNQISKHGDMMLRDMIFIIFCSKKLDLDNFQSMVRELIVGENNYNQHNNEVTENLRRYAHLIDGDINKFKYILRISSTTMSSYGYLEEMDYKVIEDVYKNLIKDLYNATQKNSNLKNVIKTLHKYYAIGDGILSLFSKKDKESYKDIYNLMYRLSNK